MTDPLQPALDALERVDLDPARAADTRRRAHAILRRRDPPWLRAWDALWDRWEPRLVAATVALYLLWIAAVLRPPSTEPSYARVGGAHVGGSVLVLLHPHGGPQARPALGHGRRDG